MTERCCSATEGSLEGTDQLDYGPSSSDQSPEDLILTPTTTISTAASSCDLEPSDSHSSSELALAPTTTANTSPKIAKLCIRVVDSSIALSPAQDNTEITPKSDKQKAKRARARARRRAEKQADNKAERRQDEECEKRTQAEGDQISTSREESAMLRRQLEESKAQHLIAHLPAIQSQLATQTAAHTCHLCDSDYWRNINSYGIDALNYTRTKLFRRLSAANPTVFHLAMRKLMDLEDDSPLAISPPGLPPVHQALAMLQTEHFECPTLADFLAPKRKLIMQDYLDLLSMAEEMKSRPLTTTTTTASEEEVSDVFLAMQWVVQNLTIAFAKSRDGCRCEKCVRDHQTA